MARYYFKTGPNTGVSMGFGQMLVVTTLAFLWDVFKWGIRKARSM
jgi:hypothetical protein